MACLVTMATLVHVVTGAPQDNAEPRPFPVIRSASSAMETRAASKLVLDMRMENVLVELEVRIFFML